MLEHLGEKARAELVMNAVESVTAEGPRTTDLGGTAGRTVEVSEAMIDHIRSRT